MHYTYWPISQEAKAIRQWNLVNYKNITWETFLLKNHTQNGVEKLFPDPFLKNQNWVYLWINILKFYTVCFYFMPTWRLLKYVETKLQTTFFYLIHSLLKNKKRSGTTFSSSFSAWFLKTNISLVIFCYLTKFYCLVAFASWDIGQYVYCICLLTRLWRHKFWN